MFSEDKTESEQILTNDSELPIINATKCEPNVDLVANNPNSTDAKSEALTRNGSELETETRVWAPPRKKWCRRDGVRRADTQALAQTQTEAQAPAQAQAEIEAEAEAEAHLNQLCDSCPQTASDSVSSRADRSDATLVVTECDQQKANDCKSEHLRDSSTQCVSIDLSNRHLRSDTKADNGLKPLRNQSMEGLRRWNTRWFTSEEAKAARRRRFSRFLYYVKVFLTHLFSTTGLCLLVMAYSCMGAFIFTFLESKHEVRQRNYIHKERVDCASDLWNHTNDLNVIYPEKWNHFAIERLKKFEERIVKAVREEGYGGEQTSSWTFSGSLLYSVTVITTIGYGNVTCKTGWGRVVTMIYALIGIPVMFLCLANLGNLMAETFRFSYNRIRCCCCRSTKHRNKSSLKTKNEKIELKNCKESEKELKVIYSENDDQKVRSIIALTPSTPPTTSVTSSQSSSPLKSFASTPVKSELSQQNNELIVIQESGVRVVVDGEGESERVPVWLVIILVIGYIMAGASMFAVWEDDWGLLEGAYFCFTTLTTIGFGDLVPGSAKYSDNKEEQTKFIICCAYLIVGLSLLAMSFNLVQEEIVIKSKAIGRRMGIIPNSEFDKSISV